MSGEGVFALRGDFFPEDEEEENSPPPPPPMPSKWQKALNHVVDTHFKIEIIMAELEYRELGFCPTLVSSIKNNDLLSEKGQQTACEIEVCQLAW